MGCEMPTEIEASFIEIDKEDLRKRLKKAGARLLQPEILMRRVVFDIDEHSFVRVRDEGERITMSYKHLDKLTIDGMKEVCVEVSSYEDTIELLECAGLKLKAEQETLRETWDLDGVEVTIDTWPWLPTYTEIEGKSAESVEKVANTLGFEMKDALYGSVDEVYKVYYDVTNADINYCPAIKFTEIPGWLAKKRKTPAQETAQL